MKERLLRFLKIYAAFVLVALLINLTMEMAIPTPEEKNAVGIAMFYLLFSLPGALVLLFRNYRPAKMGLLSLVIGFVFEFSFMRPDWVLKIYSLSAGPGEIVAVIISAIYWFIPWFVPCLILNKYVIKGKNARPDDVRQKRKA